jgi:gliding motility-associated lipoprotein GldK
MKKFVLLTAVLALFVSCGKSNDKGQLVGVKGKKWHPEKPYGMTLVPGGSFIMGKSDDDLAGVQDAPAKTVTVRAFYMDETEITNSEYNQFVQWVRDSTIRTALAEMADIEGKTPGSDDWRLCL